MSAETVRFDYSDHAVLVTGGSNGIGLATARAFADAGAAVTITGTRAGAADYGDDLSPFDYRKCEMTDAAEVDALAGSFDALDVLVNNAGTTILVDPHDPDVFDRTVTVNLNAMYRLSHGLRGALAVRGGAIVNIASMRSYFASPSSPGYGAAKAGVLEMTKTLALLYAEDGIRVNGVAPGWTETRLTLSAAENAEFHAWTISRTPLKRWGKPAELALPVLYMASNDAASFITGHTLVVDGGYQSV